MDLRGKRIAFLGDSITEGVGVADRENNRYDRVLMRLCGLERVYNYGVSGTRLAAQREFGEDFRRDRCFCSRAYDMDRAADIVVVYGGVNDYFHGDAPFGHFGDATPATFCGAVRFLMDYLKGEYPDKPVVFLTPARFFYGGTAGEGVSPLPVKGPDARPIAAYREIILQTAAELDLPVLDLYRQLPVDPVREADRTACTVDGLHFNDGGHRILAECLRDFLAAL